MIKKGIILAGGMGTRMSPLTKAVNKQLLPIYDKPLIFYPLSILMLANIRDILIIVNKGQLGQYKKIIPDGKRFGIKISFLEQDKPRGLPDAFILGENFIKKDNVAMILGDNFFYGQSLSKMLNNCTKIKNGAKVVICSKNCNYKNKNLVIIKTKNVRLLLSELASKFYKLKPKNLIAVTGTNGKTSVADLYFQILNLNKIPAASIGTLGVKYRVINEDGSRAGGPM